jgi:hypothetical protein
VIQNSILRRISAGAREARVIAIGVIAIGVLDQEKLFRKYRKKISLANNLKWLAETLTNEAMGVCTTVHL